MIISLHQSAATSPCHINEKEPWGESRMQRKQKKRQTVDVSERQFTLVILRILTSHWMFWIQHSLISTENIMTLALDATGDVGVLIRSHLQQPLLSWWHQLTGRVISCTAASAKLSEYQAKHGATQKHVQVHQQRARAFKYQGQRKQR